MRGLDETSRFVGTRVRMSNRFENVGTEDKNFGTEIGLEEPGFVGRYNGSGGLGRAAITVRVGVVKCSKIYSRITEVSAQIFATVVKR